MNHYFKGLMFCLYFCISDDASDFSSKSGTPSPILGGPRVPHGVIASRDLVRDFRESSVHSRTSSHGGDYDDFSSNREESVPRDLYDHSQRHPSPFNRTSNTSLGVSILHFLLFSFFLIQDIQYFVTLLHFVQEKNADIIHYLLGTPLTKEKLSLSSTSDNSNICMQIQQRSEHIFSEIGVPILFMKLQDD